MKDVARYFGLPMEKGDWVEVDLMPYYEALGIKNREEYSILAIHSVSDLVEELRREIPKLISDMQFIEKRHFDPENALAVGDQVTFFYGRQAATTAKRASNRFALV